MKNVCENKDLVWQMNDSKPKIGVVCSEATKGLDWNPSKTFHFSHERLLLLKWVEDEIFSLKFAKLFTNHYESSRIIELIEEIGQGNIQHINEFPETFRPIIVNKICPELIDINYFSQCESRKELLERVLWIPYIVWKKRENNPVPKVYFSSEVICHIQKFFEMWDSWESIECCLSARWMSVTSAYYLRETMIRLAKKEKIRHICSCIFRILKPAG